jgi:YHS domain-containing protein
MKRIIGLSVLIAGLTVTACGTKKPKTEIVVQDVSLEMPKESAVTPSFAANTVDNKKDPTCGMPVTAGISDTAHYENHILGFCSSECKAEFKKNPKAGLAAAELK